METCPACNARTLNADRCPRCKADLGPLLRVQAEAAFQLDLADAAFRQADYRAAQYHAQRSLSLKHSPRAVRLLAVTALVNRNIELAVSAWKNLC